MTFLPKRTTRMSITIMTTSMAHEEQSAELPTSQAGTVSTATNRGVSGLMRKWLDTAIQLRAVPNSEFTMSDDSPEADWEVWLHAAGRAVRKQGAVTVTPKSAQFRTRNVLTTSGPDAREENTMATTSQSTIRPLQWAKHKWDICCSRQCCWRSA